MIRSLKKSGLGGNETGDGIAWRLAVPRPSDRIPRSVGKRQGFDEVHKK